MDHLRSSSQPATGPACAPSRPPAAARSPWLSFPRLPLLLAALLAAFTFVPPIAGHARLTAAFAGAAGVLALWIGWLWVAALRRGERLTIEFSAPLKSHYLQGSIQLGIYAYWG